MRLWTWLEDRFAVPDDPFKSADCAVAIGTGLLPDGSGPSEQSRTNAVMAASLCLEGAASYVLLSGGVAWEGLTEARAMECVIARCVPPERLIVEDASRLTIGNAKAILAICRERDFGSVVIFAQQWHARRVRATFRRVFQGSGIDVRVRKARSPYGSLTNCQRRFWHPLSFMTWDSLGFAASWLRGWR